ncbi:15904_t:CDS:2 [Dentiscutata erythropus]|uniref:15904_t:CDS:1 n=1 Tax=Dentiscutata erythropus TaxID=1348616 RepID=A0A9N9EQN8_9GLOM|nr:15904_t:CDS:2 [Dentiscutata erythropus]
MDFFYRLLPLRQQLYITTNRQQQQLPPYNREGYVSQLAKVINVKCENTPGSIQDPIALRLYALHR